MAEKKVKRLFIFEWETLNNSLARFNSNFVEEEDYYLIFKRSDLVLKTSVDENIKRLSEFGIVEVIDCHELPPNSYMPFLLAKIKKYINYETNIYFIGCPNLHDMLKEGLSNFVISIQVKVALNHVKHTDFVIANKNNNSSKDNTNQNKTDQTSDKSREAEFLGDEVSDFINGDLPPQGKENKKKTTEDKKGKEKEKTKKDTDKKKDDKKDDKKEDKERDISNDEESDNQQNKSKSVRELTEEEILQKEKEKHDNKIRLLEKQIFTDAKIDQQVDRVYTELDDNKARMLISTFERFKKHINLVIDNEEELEDDDYDAIITQLIKSPNLDDFDKCTQIINLKANITLDSESFIIFKKEANYYIQMCNLFFKEDKF